MLEKSINKIIDGHCHVGSGRYKKQLPGQLIERMDEVGIDISVIIPVEEQISVYNEEGNRLILHLVEKYPDRFVGFAVANPWFEEKAVKIAREALANGLRGLKFNSSIQGFNINDSLVYPLVELAIRYDVPVFFHTGTPVCAIPYQVADLADQYPDAKLIMGHSGYSDYWNDVPYIASRYPNIYFDGSLSLTSRHEDILATGAGSRLLFGSDAPHSNHKYELEKIRLMNATEEEKAAILGGNISRLLKLR